LCELQIATNKQADTEYWYDTGRKNVYKSIDTMIDQVESVNFPINYIFIYKCIIYNKSYLKCECYV